VIEQSVDTSAAAGRAFFGMLAVFAAFEPDVRRERRMEGIAMAKRKGIYTGGKARLDRARGRRRSRASWGWRAAQCTGSSRKRGDETLGFPCSRLIALAQGS
jgi:DNA invertase Pin-like site-specific DNA recombinase